MGAGCWKRSVSEQRGVDRVQSSSGVRTVSVEVVGSMEKRRGDDAEDERFVWFMLTSTSWGQCPRSPERQRHSVRCRW